MNTNRLSLSNSVFEGRIKKFDSYVPAVNTDRKGSRVKAAVPSVALQSTPGRTGRLSASSFSSRDTVSQPSENSVAATPSSAKLALQAVAVSSQSLGGDAVTTHHDSVFDKFVDLKISSASTPSKRGRRRPAMMQTGMYAVGVFVFGFAMLVSVQTMMSNHQAKQQIQEVLGEASSAMSVDDEGVAQGTGSQPAEKEASASAVSSYTVLNPEAPRYLRIPELGIFSRIKQLGEKNGAIDAPWNIHDVGWYDGSAKPGSSKGASLLLGHVSGYSEPGVFKKIGDLGAGTRFEVEKGSGEKIAYEVVRSESIPLDTLSMTSILNPEIEGAHDLKLMTCSGKYDVATKQYAERLVVYAKVIR